MRRIALVLILTLSPFFLSGCVLFKLFTGGWAPDFTVAVHVAELGRGQITESTQYLSEAYSRQSTNIYPRVIADVKQIHVSPGQQVQKGQLLISLSAHSQYNQLAQAKLELDKAKEQYRVVEGNKDIAKREFSSAESTYEVATSQYDRYKGLYEQQLITSNQIEEKKNQFDKAKNAYFIAEQNQKNSGLDLRNAQKQILQSQARIRQLNAEYNYYQIRAPFSGTVGDIPVNVGDLAQYTTLLISVNNIDQMEINVYLPAEEIKQLTDKAEVEIIDLADDSIGEASILLIDKAVQGDSQNVLVKLIYNNANQLIRNGQKVYAKFNWSKREGLLVPYSVVTRIGDQKFIYIPEEGEKKGMRSAKQHPVKLSKLYGDSYEVLSGMEEGDQYISSDIVKLRNGAPIKIENEETKSESE